MDNNVITFPDATDRADREFARTGTTDYLRALDEGYALGAAAPPPDFVKRLAALRRETARIVRSRPEIAGERGDLAGGASNVPFWKIPRAIAAMGAQARLIAAAAKEKRSAPHIRGKLGEVSLPPIKTPTNSLFLLVTPTGFEPVFQP